LGGTNPDQFAQTNTCTTVAAGGSCTVSVTFSPTTTGAKTASVSIASNAAGSPHSVALTGAGVAPALSVSPASLTFGSQTVNTTSAAQTLTVTNSGTAPLLVGAVTKTGTALQAA